jgi:hypothetical protein
MTRKQLVKRVEILEARAREATPRKRDVLHDVATRALVSTFSVAELVEIRAACVSGRIELSPDQQRRYAQKCDEISMRYFERTFEELLALGQAGFASAPGLLETFF